MENGLKLIAFEHNSYWLDIGKPEDYKRAQYDIKNIIFQMSTLIVIPARSGSKGLVKKNIKHLGSKPLISYTIEQHILTYYKLYNHKL